MTQPPLDFDAPVMALLQGDNLGAGAAREQRLTMAPEKRIVQVVG